MHYNLGKSMTHLGARQGLAEVLVCPEEAEEVLYLSSMAAVSGEQLVSHFKKQTKPNKLWQ